MNPKIEQIEAAELSIETVSTEMEGVHRRAMQDGIIDADEQADLDRLAGKIERLRGVIRTLRATVEENRRIWDAQATALAEWTEQLIALHEAGKPDLGGFDTAETEIETAVADQRWADASQTLTATCAAMAPVYAAYLAEVAAIAGAGGAAPSSPPPGASTDPAAAQWTSLKARYGVVIAALERHVQSGHAVIAAEITTIKASATAAEASAASNDFSAAVATMTPLIAACAATEDKAHDVANYMEMHAHRSGLIAVFQGSPVNEALIDDLQTEIETLLSGGQADATAGRFEAAAEKLDQIPPIFERQRGMRGMQTRYLAALNNTNGWIAFIDARPADLRAPVQATIDRFKAEHTAALIANTNDYSDSVAAMSILDREFIAIGNVLNDARLFAQELASFETELNKIRDHAGLTAVNEFYQTKVQERDQAVNHATARGFADARAVLARAVNWVAQGAIADAYVIYEANRVTAQAAIDAVRALPNTGDLVAQADTLMVTASMQAVAGDIAAAEATLVEATTRANDAKTASEAQAALGALRDDVALDAVASDFPAALAVYTTMKAHVVAQDSAGTFAAAYAEADIPVAAAQAEIAGGTPDMASVRSNLDAGIAALEAVLPQILAYGLYQTHEASAVAAVQVQLQTLSTANDNCVQTAIDACEALIVAAGGFAAAPIFDFAQAEAKLAEAMERARIATVNARLYANSITPNKVAMNTALTQIAATGVNVAGRMVASSTRLTRLLAEIDAGVATEDFALAQAKGIEGAGVAATTLQDIALCQSIDAKYIINITNKIGQISLNQPEVAPQIALARQKITEFNTAMTAGAYRLAERCRLEASLAIQQGIANLGLAATYNTAQGTARANLDILAGLINRWSQEEIAAFEVRYAAALVLAAEPQFDTATKRMNEIAADAAAYLPLAQGFVPFDPARTAAETQLVAAETHTQVGAIQSTVTLLRAKFLAAEQVAVNGDPATGMAMMIEVERAATDAITNADNVEIFAGIAAAIGDSASDSWGPTAVHIGAARQAHSWQASKANAGIAAAQLGDATTQINTADNDAVPPADQTTALENAMALITTAGETISQHSLLVDAIARARSRIAPLRAHPQSAYLDAQLTEMETDITYVETSAVDLASLAGCSADLERIMTGAIEMQTKMDAHAQYIVLRPLPEVEPRLAVLEQHPHSYAIQTHIEDIRSKLLDAKRLSETFDPVPAVALLEEVRNIGTCALVLAQMRDNITPTAPNIQAILDGPDGEAELDAIIDALGPEAQFVVLEVAFEARFGCDLQQFGTASAVPGQPLPNIRRFYEIMSDLPETDTLDNDSMRLFIDRPGAAGASGYNSGHNTKRVTMRQGDAVLSSSYRFGVEDEVGQVSEECQPANDEPVNYFGWNTLHEVGHAVDDQHGFMDSREGNAAFGGWTFYGGNVEPIATVAAAHFNFDKTYIHQCLNRKLATATTLADAAAAIPVPDGCSPEVWESRRLDLVAWLGRIRSSSNPWASQATAEQIAINGVVYHECYDSKWASYQLAARSRGITAYQFRAPAEWFSEIYAAYHSGKLKDNHPAVSWLEPLTGPGA